jgi:hypothetical protein
MCIELHFFIFRVTYCILQTVPFLIAIHCPFGFILLRAVTPLSTFYEYSSPVTVSFQLCMTDSFQPCVFGGLSTLSCISVLCQPLCSCPSSTLKTCLLSILYTIPLPTLHTCPLQTLSTRPLSTTDLSLSTP